MRRLPSPAAVVRGGRRLPFQRGGGSPPLFCLGSGAAPSLAAQACGGRRFRVPLVVPLEEKRTEAGRRGAAAGVTKAVVEDSSAQEVSRLMTTCANCSGVAMAVVDTNAAITGPATLATTVGRLVTVLEALEEVRNTATRRRLALLQTPSRLTLAGDVGREVDILSRVSHSCLVRLSGRCIQRGDTYLVFKLAKNGALKDWLHGYGDNTLWPPPRLPSDAACLLRRPLAVP